MKFTDIFKTAFANTGRSKLRTFLTVLAIFIGAFTLTLTSGIGAGINQYVTKVVEGIGNENQMYVMAATAQSGNGTSGGSGPAEYDEDAQRVGEWGNAVLTEEDIETIENLNHVVEVDPIMFVSVEYIQVPSEDKFQASSLGFPQDLGNTELESGDVPDRDSLEITMPTTWVEAFGLEENETSKMVGEKVTIGVRNAAGDMETVTATVSGVSQQMISGVGAQPTPSQALYEELNELQSGGVEGLNNEQAYMQAVAVIDDMGTNEDAVKSALAEENMTGLTLEDQLGVMEAIISVITWIFNGFALIALLAASFGIVNTLLMSVQERTREIGLMKALGMTNGKVFTLFSAEAIVIGLLGSVIGIGAGVLLGWAGNAFLTQGPFSEVAGLVLFAIDPVALLLILLLIVAIAFLAGTLPATRAARKDPIESLRYE